MLKKYLLISFLLLLVACGFHLRGSLTNGQNLTSKEWQVTGDADVAALVKKELSWQYPKQIKFSESAPAKIDIKHVQIQKSMQSFNRYGRIDHAFYTLEVLVEITYQNRLWADPILIRLRRSLPYRGNSLVQESEEKGLEDDMRREVAQDIVNRLSFLSTISAGGPYLKQ